MKCRHCQHPLNLPFVDLGVMPPANAYLTRENVRYTEPAYPLKVWVCQHCWLVQTEDFTRADELFTEDYAYFSSTSKSWLAHAKKYSYEVMAEQQLNEGSFVVEIASNDGYLLQNFVDAGIPCLGVEPTRAAASVALDKGIDVVEEFFGITLAERIREKYRAADLIIANNVLAHVPDINDFVAGIATLLAPDGVCSFEFPHILNLIQYNQFDTIYHEHYSYLSLQSVRVILAKAGLSIWKVETLPTHGGSLRVWGCPSVSNRTADSSVAAMLRYESEFGLNNAEVYHHFQAGVDRVADSLRSFLKKAKEQNKLVVAYGAAAKGNTLLNYSGVTVDDIPVVFDAAKSKQGKFMPGSHIPIISPEQMSQYQPDYLMILPWNIRDEIQQSTTSLLPENCKIVTLIPELSIV